MGVIIAHLEKFYATSVEPAGSIVNAQGAKVLNAK